MTKKRALIVSDLHIGSIYSLMPEEVILDQPNSPKPLTITPSKRQQILLNEWDCMIDTIGKVDTCYVLGDCTDGTNYKSSGLGCWTTDLNIQIREACNLLGRIKTNKYVVVQGSGYHVQENMSCDALVANELNAPFGTELIANLNGYRIHLAHEIGYSTSPTSKATALQAEIANAVLNQDYYGKFDLIVRGHRHENMDLKTPWGHIIVVPGWKTRDEYAAKKGFKCGPGFIGYGLVTATDDELQTSIHWTALSPEHNIKETTL